jgi:hypothetical protein
VLSSDFTFFYKFICPGIFISIGIYFLIHSLVCGQWDAVFFAIVWLSGIMLFCYPSHLSLKRIEITKNFLVVSNYLKTIQIPFSDIRGIRKTNRFLTGIPRRIIVTLNKDSGFGRTIRFIPYSADEVINQLNHAMGWISPEDDYQLQRLRQKQNS